VLSVANEENLIPFNKMTEKQQRKIASKGGRTKSPKKKWAARLRAMKKKGLTDDNYKRIVAWMQEPESSVLDIFAYLESIKKVCKTPSQMNSVANSLIQLHKTHHGDKSNKQDIQISDSNVIINIVKPKDGNKLESEQ